MGRNATALVGLVTCVVLGAGVYFSFVAEEGLPLQEQAFPQAEFEDTGALRVGQDVRFSQARVGRVDDIELAETGDRAIVTMNLLDPQPIYRDAFATISERSGLGQSYVDIFPGDPASGELPEDEPIPVEQTGDATQFLDLISEMDEPTREAAGSLLRETGGGAAGRGGDLRDFMREAPEVLPDLGTTAESLAADGGADVTAMLNSLDSLSARFEGREHEISNTVEQLGDTFDAFAANNGDHLRATLDEAPGALEDLRSATSDLEDPVRATNSAVTEIRPGAESLAQATPDLRGVLRESPQPLNKVPGVGELAEPALGDLRDVAEDARPVAPQLTDAVGSAETPLNVLAPFSGDISRWFSFADSAVGDGDQAGHWLRLTAVPATDALSGAAPIEDPLVNNSPYPGPGEADEDSATQTPLDGGPVRENQGGN